MKTKRHFLSSFLAYGFLFVLVTGLVGYGVYAAVASKLNLGGNISFDAKDVQASISAGTLSSGAVLEDAANKMQAISIDANSDGATAMATWSGLNISFPDDASDVTITFTVANNHTEKDLLISIGEKTGTYNNATMTITMDGVAKISAIVAAKTADTTSTCTVVVTFKVTDKNKSASISNFNIPFDLELCENSVDFLIFGYENNPGVASAISVIINDENDLLLNSLIRFESYDKKQNAYTVIINNVKSIQFSVAEPINGIFDISINNNEQSFSLTSMNDTTGKIILTNNTKISCNILPSPIG